MTKRRDALKTMMLPVSAPGDSEERHARTPTKSSSLKAMGLSLQDLSIDADEAEELRQRLSSGATVVELDPETIDQSFIRDRLDNNSGSDFETLRSSIEEHGQQVPILVRPHPESDGRYQVAYGHRRLAALLLIGRPIKAIVRKLTDEELIVAQGKENIERRDLSFIEQALFAMRLEDHGFERSAMMASLATHKGNLSTMIAVARAIPEPLIVAIGSAPKIGRPRWDQLAELLRSGNSGWRDVIESPDFVMLNSEARFMRVLASMGPRRDVETRQAVRDSAGVVVAELKQTKSRVSLTIDERTTNAFGAFLIGQIPEIYAAFRGRADT